MNFFLGLFRNIRESVSQACIKHYIGCINIALPWYIYTHNSKMNISCLLVARQDKLCTSTCKKISFSWWRIYSYQHDNQPWPLGSSKQGFASTSAIIQPFHWTSHQCLSFKSPAHAQPKKSALISCSNLFINFSVWDKRD